MKTIGKIQRTTKFIAPRNFLY